jgi:hypothetical protein
MVGEGGVVTVGPIDSNTTYQHMTYENYKHLLRSGDGDYEDILASEDRQIRSF